MSSTIIIVFVFTLHSCWFQFHVFSNSNRVFLINFLIWTNLESVTIGWIVLTVINSVHISWPVNIFENECLLIAASELLWNYSQNNLSFNKSIAANHLTSTFKVKRWLVTVVRYSIKTPVDGFKVKEIIFWAILHIICRPK